MGSTTLVEGTVLTDHPPVLLTIGGDQDGRTRGSQTFFQVGRRPYPSETETGPWVETTPTVLLPPERNDGWAGASGWP